MLLRDPETLIRSWVSAIGRSERYPLTPSPSPHVGESGADSINYEPIRTKNAGLSL